LNASLSNSEEMKDIKNWTVTYNQGTYNLNLLSSNVNWNV
jgi:hypothetical protein